jgi:transposase-like protein
MVCLWRAVDAEGEVLDVLVQTRWNKRAALKLMRKLLKKYGFVRNRGLKAAVFYAASCGATVAASSASLSSPASSL